MTTSEFRTRFLLLVNTQDAHLIQWVLDTLRYQAGLLVDYEKQKKKVIFKFGIGDENLKSKAIEFRLRKKYEDGTVRLYNQNDENLQIENDETIYLIWKTIETAQPRNVGEFVPGFPEMLIKPYHTVLHLLKKSNVFLDCFPLHDPEELKKLEKSWYWSRSSIVSLNPVPIHEIKRYFGHEIAFYFAFFEFYLFWLIPPAIVGLVLFIVPMPKIHQLLIYSTISVGWWALFSKLWIRYSNSLALEWASLNCKVFERNRPQFKADSLCEDPVTGKMVPSFSGWKRGARQYFIGYPIVLMLCAITVGLSFTFNERQKALKTDMAGIYLTVMSAVIGFVHQSANIRWRKGYKKIALALTNFENYRVNSDFESQLTSKMFIFFTVNCFLGIIHKAFVDADTQEVSSYIYSYFVAQALTKQVEHTLLPYLMKRFKMLKSELKDGLETLSDTDKQIKMLKKYPGSYHDYVEIFEQFGLISMFSSVCPWACLLAIVYSFVEIRSDAFKLCNVYRRPVPEVVSGIGSWKAAIDSIGLLSVGTNIALIAMSDNVRKYLSQLSQVQYILLFFAFEHVWLLIKYLISMTISDTPKWVTVAQAKLSQAQ